MSIGWLCAAIVAWQVLAFAVWAARKLFGPLIMEWLVPTGTFPRWLTEGDDLALFGGRWIGGPAAAHIVSRLQDPRAPHPSP